MGNAIKIKNWCESDLSPMAWPLIAMRALPEIMAEGRKVSLMNISEKTEFDPVVVKVISKCVWDAYQVQIPTNILTLGTSNAQSANEEKPEVNNKPGIKGRFIMAMKILFNKD